MVSGRNPKGIPILSSPYWWYNPISPSKLILNSCVQCKCGNYKPVRIDNENILYIYSEVWYLHPLIDKFKLSSLKIHYCYFLLFYRLIEEDGNKADGRKKEAVHFFWRVWRRVLKLVNTTIRRVSPVGGWVCLDIKVSNDYRHNTKAAAATGKG